MNDLVVLSQYEEETKSIAILEARELKLKGPAAEAYALVRQLEIITGPTQYYIDRMKGEILVKLVTGDLWRYHPSDPTDLMELLQSVGISKSEFSDLYAWEKYIFPYIQEHLGLHPWEVARRINKTKRRLLTPRLRALCDPGHFSTSDKIKKQLAQVEQEVGDVPDKKAAMVKHLLGLAEDHPTHIVREMFSVEPTPPVELTCKRHRYVVVDNDSGEVIDQYFRYHATATLTDDQLQMLLNVMADHIRIFVIEGEPITINGAKGNGTEDS